MTNPRMTPKRKKKHSREWDMKGGLPVIKEPALPTTSSLYLDGLKREDWERLVFDEVEYFTCIRKVGPGKRERLEFKDFGDALRAAIVPGTLKIIPGVMVYAVNAAGRSFCLRPQDWKMYYEIWLENQKGKVNEQKHSA